MTNESYDDHLPKWQGWINQFCENWLFAFVVVVAFKHFLFEMYVIPSASMEPTLFGHPSFLKADKVIAAKFPAWLGDPERWDVTVFEYPVPEVIESGRHTVALQGGDQRRDNLVTNPLVHRNFVKRLIGLPQETFYIDQGDIFIQQPDGDWQQPRKPTDVQEALWTPIYHHRAEAKVPYVPWEALGGASSVRLGEYDTLVFDLEPDSSVNGTQPLVNLYLKEGEIGIASDRTRERFVVQASMIAPAFEVPGGGTGNIWELNKWNVFRRTPGDYGPDKFGKLQNQVGNEFVRDLRITMVPIAIEGEVRLDLGEGQLDPHTLVLTAEGWQLRHQGAVIDSGEETPLNRPVALVHLDDRLWLTIDGERVSEQVDTGHLDPKPTNRSYLRWHGDGRLELDDLEIERDVHYAVMGFLTDRSLFQVDPGLEPFTGSDKGIFGHPGVTRAVGHSPETAITIPEDAYLLLGDNSTNSLDSRVWGFVPGANIRGQVWFVIDRFEVVE